MATLLDAAGTAATGSTFALPVGTSFAPGDLRIVRITIGASATFGTTPTGWMKIHDTLVSGSGRVAVFARILQSGDTDATVSASPSTTVERLAITLRGVAASVAADLTSLAPSTAGSSTAAATADAPSVATGAGTLLTFHTITRTSGANTTTWTSDPAGMTRRATAIPSTSAGYVAVLESEARTSGTSGTRTATASGSGAWRATALFVPDGAAPAVVPPADHFHVLA